PPPLAPGVATRIEQPLELVSRQDRALETELAHALAGAPGLLRDRRRGVVADRGYERGQHRQDLLHERLTSLTTARSPPTTPPARSRLAERPTRHFSVKTRDADASSAIDASRLRAITGM